MVVFSWELSTSIPVQEEDKHYLGSISRLLVPPSFSRSLYPDSDGLVSNKVLHLFLVFSGKVLDVVPLDPLYLKVFSSGSVSSYGNLEISVC